MSSMLPTGIIDNLPAIAAMVAFVFTILEYFFGVRGGKARTTGYARSIVLMLGALAATTTFLLIIFSYWHPKDEWVLWKERFARTFKSCVEAGTNANLVRTKDSIRNFDKGDDGKIESSDELNFQCLTITWNKHKRPSGLSKRVRGGEHPQDKSDYTSAFWRDVHTAQLLFEIKGVPDTLSNSLSLYSNEFLGTGFTFPHGERSRYGAPGYFAAGVREYLVRNICLAGGAKAKDNCPSNRQLHHERAWVWQFTQTQIDAMTKDRKFSNVIESLPRELDKELNFNQATQYKNYRESIIRFGDNLSDTYDNPVLVRIAKFNRQYYRNTLGHPKRHYAFFADLRDYWNLTWKQAITMSATTPGEPSSEDRWFIWIYIADSIQPDYSGLAVWGYVFSILETNLKSVNTDLRKLMERP